jgi:hypothetical protein
MRLLVASLLACIACGDPELGEADWNEVPTGAVSSFGVSWATHTASGYRISFTDYDGTITCSDFADDERMYNHLEVTMLALAQPGIVPIVGVLDTTRASATASFSSDRSYTSGMVELTKVGDMLTGTFMATGTRQGTMPVSVSGRFSAPRCD